MVGQKVPWQHRGYRVSVARIQMSAVADTKMFSFGYIFSLSVQDIFFHKEGREKCAHSNRARRWLDGRPCFNPSLLTRLLQFPVSLAEVSCFLFASCEPSCVWARGEERKSRTTRSRTPSMWQAWRLQFVPGPFKFKKNKKWHHPLKSTVVCTRLLILRIVLLAICAILQVLLKNRNARQLRFRCLLKPNQA